MLGPTPETFVTGPTQLPASGIAGSVDVTAKTLSLSSSSGRWLVTESDYSTALKLNKYAIAPDSTQQVTSLFTVMDNLGNITDLVVDDPGYVLMAGDPSYTTTFPSVFASGLTPDLELLPGTKYQVEVKATNDLGNDSAFSNDVMPVAGLLQTSVITANVDTGLSGLDPSVSYTDTSITAILNSYNVTAITGVGLETRGDTYTNELINLKANGTRISATTITTTVGTAYVGAVDYTYQGFFASGSATSAQGQDSLDYACTISPAASITGKEITISNTVAGNSNSARIYILDQNGAKIYVIGNTTLTVLTTADNTNYNLFSVGDAVIENSGGTPVTSAITNVSAKPQLATEYT